MFLNLIYYIKSCVLHTVCTHGSAQVFHFVQLTFTMDHIWFLINPYIKCAYNQLSLQICPHFVYRDRRFSNRTKDLPLQRKERKSNCLYHWHVLTCGIKTSFPTYSRTWTSHEPLIFTQQFLKKFNNDNNFHLAIILPSLESFQHHIHVYSCVIRAFLFLHFIPEKIFGIMTYAP